MGVRALVLGVVVLTGCYAARIPPGPAPQPFVGSAPPKGSFEGFAGGHPFVGRTGPTGPLHGGGSGQIGMSIGTGQGVSLQLAGEYRYGSDDAGVVGRWSFGVRRRIDEGLMVGGRLGAGLASGGPFGHAAAEFGWMDRGKPVRLGFDATLGASVRGAETPSRFNEFVWLWAQPGFLLGFGRPDKDAMFVIRTGGSLGVPTRWPGTWHTELQLGFYLVTRSGPRRPRSRRYDRWDDWDD